MSELRAALISDLAGTGPAAMTKQWAAKSFLNFNGAGTVTVNSSGNISSVTDLAVGTYAPNMTTALADTHYTSVFGGSNFTGDGRVVSLNSGSAKTTTQFRIVVYNGAFSASDADSISVEATR